MRNKAISKLRSSAFALAFLAGTTAFAQDAGTPAAETPSTPVAETPKPAPTPVGPVVRIGDSTRFFCTGFVISPALVATAGHCADGDKLGPTGEYRVQLSDSSSVRGFLAVASHPFAGFADFALIRLLEPIAAVETAKLRCGEKPLEVGERVSATGFPGVFEGTPITAWGQIAAPLGRVARASGIPWQTPVYVAQIPVGHGDSGGPMFDSDGRVFAIMVGTNADQPGWSIAQPVDPLLCAFVASRSAK